MELTERQKAIIVGAILGDSSLEKRLNTDAFSFAEQQLLQSAIERNFGIQTKLHRKGKYWNIYIPETSAFKFAEVDDTKSIAGR